MSEQNMYHRNELHIYKIMNFLLECRCKSAKECLCIGETSCFHLCRRRRRHRFFFLSSLRIDKNRKKSDNIFRFKVSFPYNPIKFYSRRICE